MYLRFAALSAEEEYLHGAFCMEEIELAMEILNLYVNEGHTLFQASLEESGKEIPLPLEAFDGQPIRIYMQQLQEEWNQVLSLSH
ncbi:hypothetical protein [Larkinella soli]|uniref:hypothetical protein n=1 Tax=Larkinella soli TaxID=1770527 RepID=UPI000FFB304F|nr:hypothetical protein [Larkinella soli]